MFEGFDYNGEDAWSSFSNNHDLITILYLIQILFIYPQKLQSHDFGKFGLLIFSKNGKWEK